MAVDTTKDWQPLGTLHELRQYGVNPKRYGSCARPVEGRVRGCAWYDVCRIRRILENKGKQSPEMIGFDITTPEGDMDGKITECFNYHLSAIHRLRAEAETNGFVVDQFKVPGETVVVRGSRRKHVKRDPDCPACATSTCFSMQAYAEPVVIPNFVRLGENQSSRHTMMQAKRERVLERLDHERELSAIEKIAPEADLQDDGLDDLDETNETPAERKLVGRGTRKP